ncbi:hypothetical protein JLBLGABF_00042 [Klebsiella phage KP13MC5-2]|uniref:Uncharacterized protein n=1 Tax=Klebsiella phage KP13MC5-2 TaxID=2985664 RepID=A0AAX3DF01_9CAUD|nr:hypothetical protein JLBLGABF_00042 [Klebsiella phage KP13MC5-2]
MTTTMQADGVTFYPLSSIASTIVPEYPHAVYRYTQGRWAHFHVGRNRPMHRVVHKHNGYLEFVKVDGKKYYIDDACTLRV